MIKTVSESTPGALAGGGAARSREPEPQKNFVMKGAEREHTGEKSSM